MKHENLPPNYPKRKEGSNINWGKEIEVVNEETGEVKITHASGEVEHRFLGSKTTDQERKRGEELSAVEKLRLQSDAEYQRIWEQAHKETAQEMERYRNTLMPPEFEREFGEALQKKAEQLAQAALEKKE